MTKIPDTQFDEKLSRLQEEFERAEQRMRKAAVDYQDLIAEKESILSNISALKKSQSEKRAR